MFSPFSSLSSFSFFSVCEKIKNTSVIGHMNNIRPSQASMHRDNDSFIKLILKVKCTDHIPQTATPNKNKVMPSSSHFPSDSPKENFDAFQFLWWSAKHNQQKFFLQQDEICNTVYWRLNGMLGLWLVNKILSQEGWLLVIHSLYSCTISDKMQMKEQEVSLSPGLLLQGRAHMGGEKPQPTHPESNDSCYSRIWISFSNFMQVHYSDHWFIFPLPLPCINMTKVVSLTSNLQELNKILALVPFILCIYVFKEE